MNLAIPTSLVELRANVLHIRGLLPELKRKHTHESEAFNALTARVGFELTTRIDSLALGDYNEGENKASEYEGTEREVYEASRRLSAAHFAAQRATYDLKEAEETLQKGLFDLFVES